MTNEDIVTSLKNSIERGENLENAMNILVGSGYPTSEVQEASKYVGQGVMSNLQPTPEEDIAIQPSLSQKGKIPAISQTPQNSQQPIQNLQSQQPANYSQTNQSSQSQQLPTTPQIPQTSTQLAQTPLERMPRAQMPKVKIKKKSHKKEIILAVVLLILILTLGGTLLFKEKILSFFSS
jgi:FtsZ-interacting cell division protein ZipA